MRGGGSRGRAIAGTPRCSGCANGAASHEAPRAAAPSEKPGVARMPANEYLDRYVKPPAYLKQQQERLDRERSAAARFPPRPERDVLGFVMANAPLENW